MSGAITRRALRQSLRQIRYVTPVAPAAATGLVQTVYGQVERHFGMLAPPVALHSPAPQALAACWLMLRESLLVPGNASRAAKETVAAGVSAANGCPYCVAVHKAAIHSLASVQVTGEVTSDHAVAPAEPAGDARLRALAAWARSTGNRDRDGSLVTGQPVAEEAAELAAVAVTFHYLSRMVSVFLEDSPLPAVVPAALSSPMMRMLGRIMLSADVAGTDDLLPAAEGTEELVCLADSPRLANAFARASAAVERTGLSAVPAAVRELIRAELPSWDGSARGPGRAWVDVAVSGLPDADRPAGRLALLTAFASYSLLDSDVMEARSSGLGDAQLIGLTSWASLAAAMQIGSWLGTQHAAALPVPSIRGGR